VAAIVMATVTTALYYVVFFNCRERLSGEAPIDHVSPATSLKQMVRNPIWRIVFAFALIIFIRLGVLVSSLAFFAKDVLGTPWMISVLLPLLSVALLVGGFLAGLLLRRVTKRVGNYLTLGISALLLLVLPFAEGNPPLFIGIFVLSSVGGGIQGATTFILLADMVEEHETRFGNRAEGLLVSSVSFGMKVGMAIGAAATAYALGWAGYTPDRPTETANQALSWLFYGAPVALMLAQAVCISFLREGPASTIQSQENDKP
jgi:GPH family glycoside/pentoside/hexuronide:cation symporter